MSLSGIRGTVYGLFGVLILSTLWVTSLTLLSAPVSATTLIADAGADILNPFLIKQGFGITPSTYATLEASAKAHPTHVLDLPLLKVQVVGREIIGHTYPTVVHLIYSRVADGYYGGGATAVFDIPPQLQSVLPSFALFNPDNIPIFQGGPTVSQLPPFLQPFFVIVGLTPSTFTQAGHARLLRFLPWFWLVSGVLLVLAVILNPTEKKLAGISHAIIHSTWPIVAILLGLSVAGLFAKTTLGPYEGVIGVIRGAFLPIYGTALLIGLVSLVLVEWLPALRARRAAAAPIAAPVPTPGAHGGGSPFMPTTPPDRGPSQS